MEKNKLVRLIAFVSTMIIILVMSILIVNYNNNRIPTNYIAVFSGIKDNKKYSTYMYKKDNDSDTYGYKFINTVSNKQQEKNYTILLKGEVDWKDQILNIAKKNNAYDTVKYQGRDISIDDFINTFIKTEKDFIEEQTEE